LVEIDEVAARLLRQYWALLVICVAVPIVAISLVTAKQPARYAASARIITGSVVPQSSAEADAVVSQVEALATGRTAAARALGAAGANRNLTDFISNDIAVSGLGSSQVIDLTITDHSPQVAQKVDRILATEVVGSINNVGQSGLRAALTANDEEIVRLSQKRAIMGQRAASHPQDQQLQAQLAGLDQVIANFTGDRSRLLIQAGSLGLATVIDQPAMPIKPQSKASTQKLGLAGLLGLAAGILIASIAETLRPTVPGAPRVSRRLGVPTLGHLNSQDLDGAHTPALGEMALRFRLVAAHAGLSTIALVDIDGKRELAALAAGLMQTLHAPSPDGAGGRAGLDGTEGGNQRWIMNGADGPGGPSGLDGTEARNQRWDTDAQPTLAMAGPSVLVKPRGTPAENTALHVYPLGQMKWWADPAHVGIVILSGPVARVSRITALQDLSASSGWPIVGVVGVPRMRRWRRRWTQQAAGVTGSASSGPRETGAEYGSGGRGQ
jgi:capsular polysaccharide biosynthesis protein